MSADHTSETSSYNIMMPHAIQVLMNMIEEKMYVGEVLPWCETSESETDSGAAPSRIEFQNIPIVHPFFAHQHHPVKKVPDTASSSSNPSSNQDDSLETQEVVVQ